MSLRLISAELAAPGQILMEQTGIDHNAQCHEAVADD